MTCRILQHVRKYKFGVLYCKGGQHTEEEFFGNGRLHLVSTTRLNVAEPYLQRRAVLPLNVSFPASVRKWNCRDGLGTPLVWTPKMDRQGNSRSLQNGEALMSCSTYLHTCLSKRGISSKYSESDTLEMVFRLHIGQNVGLRMFTCSHL